MRYEELTQEAKDVLHGMVEYCLNNRACLGMDEGIADFETGIEHAFVSELRAFNQNK